MAAIDHADATMFEARLATGLPIHNHEIGRHRHLPAARVSVGGVHGYGEAPALPTFTGFTHDATFANLREVVPTLCGRDPEAALAWVHSEQAPTDPQARAALDIALHDLLAKLAGVPVYRRLGTKSPHSVRISRAIGLHPVERVVHLGRGYVAQGVTSLKVKVGRGVQDDAEVLLRLREAVGDHVELALDANEGYGLEDAADLWRQARGAAPAYFEQPVARHEVRDMTRLRGRGVVVFADESAFVAADVTRLARQDAIDGVIVKLVKSGGLVPARAMADEALEHGLPVLVVDPLGSAISLLAGLHLAATLPPMPHAHGLSAAFDVDAPHAPHTPVHDGHQAPPERPGLGTDVAWTSHHTPATIVPTHAERTQR